MLQSHYMSLFFYNLFESNNNRTYITGTAVCVDFRCQVETIRADRYQPAILLILRPDVDDSLEVGSQLFHF
jgi:hypothetical protein